MINYVDTVEALEQLGYDWQPKQHLIGGMGAGELLRKFESGSIKEVVAIYAETFEHDNLLARVIRSVLGNSERIDEIRKLAPELFI